MSAGAVWCFLFLHWQGELEQSLFYFGIAMLAVNFFFMAHAISHLIIPLSDIERPLYNNYFSKLGRGNFKKLVAIGKFENKANGATLIKQGERNRLLFFVVDGSAVVLRDNQKIKTLKNGDIIGDISYISGNLASATVRSEVLSTFLVWKQDEVRELLRKNPGLLIEFNALLEKQISRKLIDNS